MILSNNIYDITWEGNNKLVISLSAKKVLFNTLIHLLLSGAILAFYFYKEPRFDSDRTFLFLGFLCLGILVQLGRDLYLIFSGQQFVFNRSLNTIEKNHKRIGKVDAISNIIIRELAWGNQNNRYHQVYISLDGYPPIKFARSTNMEQHQDLGQALYKLTGVSVEYSGTHQKSIRQDQDYKEAQFKSNVAVFEEQYKNKDRVELEEIAREDGPFSVHARQAALNILEHQHSVRNR